MTGTWLKGQCPMGCGQTLFADQGGYVVCSYIGCPNPEVVADFLERCDPTSAPAAAAAFDEMVRQVLDRAAKRTPPRGAA